jgi:ribosomal protection tetracycline resistance protein
VVRKQLNLGILAHVDAGKTTLTERLLYGAGVLDELGSVDAGTTLTDSLTLERRRGITIKSAVASFALGDVHVNLIDTPGHPDFIAEVERVLSVLDGAVLVVSAVEGVQPQTRILMRALQRLHIPTLIFVNKIDRTGAGYDGVLAALTERLAVPVVAMGAVDELGTRTARFTPFDAGDASYASALAEVLAERSDAVLAAYVDDGGLPAKQLADELRAQTRRAVVHPVFFGSASTGAGVDSLAAGIAQLLPQAAGNPDGSVSASVFKIERGPGGEKVAYARMFSGTIRTRDRLEFGHDGAGKVTALAVFESGGATQRPAVAAGEVAKLWGLAEVRIGDLIGESGADRGRYRFPPPTLEAVVVPDDPDDGGRLLAALAQLAEQDPLIDVRADETGHERSVSLYGEVQMEVIQSTLADEYDLGVTFREATPICVERPVACGAALELLNTESNPYRATIGFRIEPAPAGTGVRFVVDVDHTGIPLYVFKTRESFTAHMEQYVRAALQEGLYGWQVIDCTVTLDQCGYSVPDGPPSRRGPLSTAADFRKLTPIVLAAALEQARSVVCEPIVDVSIELPTDTIGSVASALARLGGAMQTSSTRGRLATIETVLPAARAQELQRRLPSLTGGEGVLAADFGGYEEVLGPPPRRGKQAVTRRADADGERGASSLQAREEQRSRR